MRRGTWALRGEKKPVLNPASGPAFFHASPAFLSPPIRTLSVALLLLMALPGCFTFAGAFVGDTLDDRQQQRGFGPVTDAVAALPARTRVEFRTSRGQIVSASAGAVIVRPDSVMVEELRFGRADLTGVRTVHPKPRSTTWGIVGGAAIDLTLYYFLLLRNARTTFSPGSFNVDG